MSADPSYQGSLDSHLGWRRGTRDPVVGRVAGAPPHALALPLTGSPPLPWPPRASPPHSARCRAMAGGGSPQEGVHRGACPGGVYTGGARPEEGYTQGGRPEEGYTQGGYTRGGTRGGVLPGGDAGGGLYQGRAQLAGVWGAPESFDVQRPWEGALKRGDCEAEGCHFSTRKSWCEDISVGWLWEMAAGARQEMSRWRRGRWDESAGSLGPPAQGQGAEGERRAWREGTGAQGEPRLRGGVRGFFL